jgi:ferredoxin-NADP reductase/predicted pyridoxine 5'-phosphate oxidase superfamily flavin-nucleotide-binding protein
MSRAFSQITYTPSVRAAQTRYGSREANAGFDTDPNQRNTVSARELDFIPAIDTFFIASVGENGWPYVQHRGGPKGFLKILDEHTLGFADFAGNRQYISAGNIFHDDRVVLFLIDFARRRRLKVWGRARIVHESDEPDMIARLEVPTYRARVERGFVITIEALDFNCPQHITPRFTEEEIVERFASMQPETEVRARPSQSATNTPIPAASTILGSGELELVITGIRQLTPRVRAYELRRPDGSDLPVVAAGSHLPVPVRLEDGMEEIRNYSIASNPACHDAYEITVLREDSSRGGSVAVHRDYALGTVIRCGMPRNAFSLHDDARPAVLIAGGIGITPIKAMAHVLQKRGTDFHLHYAARTHAEMAYRSTLGLALRDHVTFYLSDGQSGDRLNLGQVFEDAPANAVFYICGPSRLLEAARRIAQTHGIDAGRVRYERFTAPVMSLDDKPVEIVLKRSGRTLHVPADQSILDAVTGAGVDVPFECRSGTCGSCATRIIDGIADHRDTALTEKERNGAALMCTCVSRAKTDRLVLDL